MLQLLDYSLQTFQFALVPLCRITAWLIILSGLWGVGLATREGVANIKRLHQIPCSNCQFFTDNYRLKCPVRPFSALTEAAINCSDFCPRDRAI